MTRIKPFLARSPLLLLLLMLLLLVAGCDRPINRAAERRIRDAMPDVLGPAKRYRVHVANDPGRTLGGKLAKVTIDGDDVQFPNGLMIDHLLLDVRNVDIDTRHRRVRSIGATRFEITISKAALDEFLAGEAPKYTNITDPRVTIAAGNVLTITAARTIAGVSVPFRLTGPLRLAGPTKVELDATRLEVVGIPIAGIPLQFLKGRIESACDVSGLPFPVTLTGVSTVPGQVTLAGTAEVAALLEKTQGGK